MEVCSSGCATVGFFVGYSVALGKRYNGLCKSREGDAETNIDWGLMPPLCRPNDDVDKKNMQIQEKRQKRESETTRGAEDDSCKDESEEDESEDDETVEGQTKEMSPDWSPML